MQQTRIDRWLKERFVLETEVFMLSAPPWVPKRVKLQPLEVTLKNRFQYRMVIRKRRDLEKALQALTDANQTFTTNVQSRRTWCRRWFDDPYGSSFTWRIIGYIVIGSAAFTLFRIIPWDQVHRIGEAFDFLKEYM